MGRTLINSGGNSQWQVTRAHSLLQATDKNQRRDRVSAALVFCYSQLIAMSACSLDMRFHTEIRIAHKLTISVDISRAMVARCSLIEHRATSFKDQRRVVLFASPGAYINRPLGDRS